MTPILLITKLIPLYLLIGLGYFAGKKLSVDKVSVAKVLIYLLVPIAIFGFVAQIKLDRAVLLAPIFSLLVHTLSTILSLSIAKRYLAQQHAALAGYCAACANGGYFGIPLFLMFHKTDELGVYMVVMIGYLFYESGPAYYVLSRGMHSAKDSLLNVVRLPIIYGALAGLLYNLAGLKLPEIFLEYLAHIKGAYIVLGMMLVGLALSEIKKFQITPKLLIHTLCFKFIITPVLMLGAIYFDKYYLNILTPLTRGALITLAAVPVAANTAAFASLLKVDPEQAGVLVVLSTLVAIPVVIFIFPFLISLCS